ncbi:hypothetical protein ES332_A05G337900v1 [Gossypium tomentosum]|uniref:Uncharacterized protein n=1 Tax=Gossypium tomentosum TaxID=34277 RepID=A0A5D2QNC9_GOSTO|nr:hypothetical protein ES332_A05G337900v1 [Gossypium tomentosum]
MTSLRPFAVLEFSGNFFSIGQFKIVILFSCGKSRACPYIVFILDRLFRCKNSSLENKFEFPFSSATSLSLSSLIISSKPWQSRINSCSKCGAKIIQLLASLN